MGRQTGISRTNIFIGVIVAIAVVTSAVVVFRSATTKEKETSLGEVFIYDVEEISKTDPALVKYEESRRIDTGFQSVFAVAVDSKDQIYVAGDRSIKIFSGNGDTLSEVQLAGAPGCLTVDAGNIYIGIADHIEVYDPSGTRKTRWQILGENIVLTSVAVSENDIFVADAGNRVVLRYNGSGKLVGRIGERDTDRNIPGLVTPSPYLDLAVASDGLLRITNPGLQRIEAYTFDGDLELSWGKPANSIEGFVGCCNPVNFAILPDGNFVTCEKGIPRVKVYNAEGVFESVVAGAELFSQVEGFSALDVAVDSQGRIMVLDPVERAVRTFVSRQSLVDSQ